MIIPFRNSWSLSDLNIVCINHTAETYKELQNDN